MQIKEIGTIIYKDKTKILNTKPIKAKIETIELEKNILMFFCEKLKEFESKTTKTYK